MFVLMKHNAIELYTFSESMASFSLGASKPEMYSLNS